MIATNTFAKRPINFDECMARVSKIEPSAKTARSRSELIGVSENTYGTWKKRGTVPFQELVELCIKRNVDLNWFFRGGSDIPVPFSSNEKYHDSEIYENNEITEEIMKDAMMLISSELARAQVPWSEEVVSMLIKTYLKFKDSPGGNIKMIIRAVAESQAE